MWTVRLLSTPCQGRYVGYICTDGNKGGLSIMVGSEDVMHFECNTGREANDDTPKGRGETPTEVCSKLK